MDQRVTYDEHLGFLVKQERGARCERQGFQDAKLFQRILQFSSDQYEQRRYADGFETGKEKILFDGMAEKGPIS